MDHESLDALLGPRLDWSPVPAPAKTPLVGAYVSLEPINAERHASALYAASHGERADPYLWVYLAAGPYETQEAFAESIRENSESADPLYYAVVPAGRPAAGQVSYLRLDPARGVIEIGHIWFGLSMQRTAAATEAIYLLAKHVFDDLGYRRLEWKCNARNQRSRRAAERFGFSYEGTFRNAVVVRDRNRDTAWYSIIDSEWPFIREAFHGWLAPSNFDAAGNQRQSLADLRTSP